MIKHLIKRDFKDNAIYWFFVAFIFMICLFGVFTFQKHKFKMSLLFPIEILFLFGLGIGSTFIGTSLRSQHQMSRTYMLNLPVSRNKYFNVIILRAFICYIPFFIIAILFPFPEWFKFFPAHKGAQPTNVNMWAYPFVLIIGTIGFQNSLFVTTLIAEDIMRYTSKNEKILGWIKTIGGMILTGGIIITTGTSCIFTNNIFASFLCFLGMFLVALLNYLIARKKWIGE